MKYVIAYFIDGRIVFLTYAISDPPLGSTDFPGGLFYNSEIGFFDKGEADESFDLMTVTDEGKVLRSDRRWSAGDVAYYKLGVYEANEEGRRIWTEAYERIGLLSREDLSREGGALALKKEEARCLLVESVLEQMGVNE